MTNHDSADGTGPQLNPDDPRFVLANLLKKDPEAPPLASYTIPPAHRMVVIHLLQQAEDTKRESAVNKLWMYLDTLFPGTKDYRCKLNVDDRPWEPVLELLEPLIFPAEGKNGCTQVVKVEGNDFVEFMSFVDMGHGPLPHYLLWDFLATKYPIIKLGRAWRIFGTPKEAYIWTKEPILKPVG